MCITSLQGYTGDVPTGGPAVNLHLVISESSEALQFDTECFLLFIFVVSPDHAVDAW